MDLKNMLNEEPPAGQDNSSAPSHAAQPKRPPPPPLTTSRSTSVYDPSPHSNTFESPQRYTHPPIAQSPGGSLPPPSAHSFTSTPYSALPPQQYQSPYQRNALLPSPGPRSGSLSNHSSYYAPAQRPPSHHSLHRSSTSPLDPIPPFNGSPQLSRNPPTLQPHTPLGPPPPILRRESTHSSQPVFESPVPQYQRHRSSSGASYASPSNQSQTLPPPPRSGPSYPEPTPRRESVPTHQYQRPREDSVSVSPRTVYPTISRPYPDSETPRPISRETSNLTAVSNSTMPHSTRETSLSYQPSHQAPEASQPPQPAHGVKRAADPETLAPPQHSKKPKLSGPIPIWARPKSGLPAWKIVSQSRFNMNRPGRSPQPQMAYRGAQSTAQPAPAAQKSYNSIHDDSFERSVRDMVPSEDLTRQVMDFVFANVVAKDYSLPLEIEAKIGRIVDINTNERLSLPINSEAVVSPMMAGISFESRMDEGHHEKMNKFLNETVGASQNGVSSSTGKARIPIKYQHLREVDAFYSLPPQELQRIRGQLQNVLDATTVSRGDYRVRISRNIQTGEIVNQVVKARLHDLNVFCPNSAFDWRVSVSIELPYDGDLEALAQYAESIQKRRPPNRNKDRMSYKHQFCTIDLTQVKIGVQPGGQYERKSHELEVEFDVQVARAEGQLAMRGQPNHYSEFLKVFVDNVRILARHM